MEDITYEDALNYYYSYKQRYESKYNAKKAKIINDDDMTKKQKQAKVKAIKMPCISCKKPVGTTFEDRDRYLIAVCGNQDQPCNLNIQIRKSGTLLTDNYVPDLLEEKQLLENDIIRLKLSFLFGFIDEEELGDVFEELKVKIGNNSDMIELTNDFLKSTLEMEERTEQIKILNVEKYNYVKDIKNMMREFLATKNMDMLKDAVAMNIESMNEVVDKLQANKYREMFVETTQIEQGKLIHLIQRENSIQDKEYEVTEGEVISYVI